MPEVLQAMRARSFFTKMCKLEYEFRNPGASLAMDEVYRNVRRFYEKLSEEEREPLRIMEMWDQERVSRLREELQLHQKLSPKEDDDDGRLKRPCTPFLHFTRQFHASVRKEHPNWTFVKISKAISEKWRSLTSKEKAPYVNKWKMEKRRYEKAKREYEDEVVAPGIELRHRRKSFP